MRKSLSPRAACSSQMQVFEQVDKVTWVDDEWKTESVSVFHVAKESFAVGSQRSAHEAHFGDESIRFVAKRYLNPPDDPEETEQDYLRDVQLQSIAHAMGKLFNEHAPPKKVDFIEAFLVRADGCTWAVEPRLKDGDFVKFSNNTGFVAQKDAEIHNTPHALSHFSWVASKNTFIINDVQGVDNYFTDPVRLTFVESFN